MKYWTQSRRIASVVGMLMLCAATAFAVPTLQLDIDGGSWLGINANPVINESTITTDNAFTLGALLTPGNQVSNSAADFFLAIAITNANGSSVNSLGSATLDVDGSTLGDTDFQFGNPGLPPHGVFDTYYHVVTFNFANAATVTTYDVESQPGYATADANGETLLVEFEIDRALLGDGYLVHFDLFTEVPQGPNNIRTISSPFSHDATSIPGPIIPEPATVALLGLGLTVGGMVRRRRRTA